MFELLQIITLLTLVFLICIKTQKRLARLTITFLGALVTTIQIISIRINEGFVDYRFFNHINWDAFAGHGFQFYSEITAFILFFVLLFYVLNKAISAVSKYDFSRNIIFIPSSIIVSIFLFFPNGVFSQAYQIFQTMNAEEVSFSNALKGLGINPEDYTTPEKLTATQGKNIVVISVESLEQGFLSENLTPNLSALSTEWIHYNMSPAPGSNWTAGSLYTHQTGMPAFLKGQSNSFFQGAKNVKLTGLGHVLNKAGYSSRYLVGNKEFAGMSDILSAYGITSISETNSIGKYDKFYDLDLFNEAKLQIKKLSNQDKPFALFLSTLNTHFPKGIYDPRMKSKIPTTDSGLKFSITAVDHLIGDFIEYLKNENLYKDTSIYIFPDHLIMGGSDEILNSLNNRNRELFVLTNANKTDLSVKNVDTIYQIDLPRLIIEGSKIKTNAKFFSDFIHSRVNLASYIKDNITAITSLNSASIKKTNYLNEIHLNTKNEKLILNSGKSSKEFKFNPSESEEVFDLTFNKEMVLLSGKLVTREAAFSYDDFDSKYGRIHLILHIEKGILKSAYLGNKKLVGIFKTGGSIDFSKNEIATVYESNQVSSSISELLSLTITKTASNKATQQMPFLNITSSEKLSSKNFPSKIKVGLKSLPMGRGLNLITLDENNQYQAIQYDTYGDKDNALKLIDKLEDLIHKKQFWALASNDNVGSSLVINDSRLKAIGFETLQKISGAKAYIAYSQLDQTIIEYQSDTYLTKDVVGYHRVKEPIASLIEDKENRVNLKKISSDKSRFIAHAGGSIEGRIYTNSLEALDVNYNNGFRMFELDISKTSDGVYVASHGWDSWARNNSYTGALPPDRETFMSIKFLNQFTPLDIESINGWFSRHPDAILVTDKVNSPKEFSEKFIDKNRLMMELFSWETVDEAIKSKIKSAMPTGAILDKIEGDKIEFLKKKGITDIAMSRRVTTDSQVQLLHNLRKANVNVYAFHINFDKGIDESYVICNENDYFYGIYADRWDFKKEVTCPPIQ